MTVTLALILRTEVRKIMDSKKLTTKEVAKRERITSRTVRNLCESGDLPAYKVGGQWRIDADYEKHLRESKTAA